MRQSLSEDYPTEMNEVMVNFSVLTAAASGAARYKKKLLVLVLEEPSLGLILLGFVGLQIPSSLVLTGIVVQQSGRDCVSRSQVRVLQTFIVTTIPEQDVKIL